MNCPACQSELAYRGYSKKQWDHQWYCQICDLYWWQRTLRELQIARRKLREKVKYGT